MHMVYVFKGPNSFKYQEREPENAEWDTKWDMWKVQKETKGVFFPVQWMFLLSVRSGRRDDETLSRYKGNEFAHHHLSHSREKWESLPPSVNIELPPTRTSRCHYWQYFTSDRQREEPGQEKRRLSWYQARGNIESLYKQTHSLA